VVAPAIAPPIVSGDSTEYFADLYTMTRSARSRWSASGWVSQARSSRMSRYWPAVTSVRIR
jgi:hypothetical protein